MALSSRNDYCCVPECRSWARRRGLSTVLSFHFFPKENENKVYLETTNGRELVDRRKAWILKLKLGKQVTKYMKVCSLHFTDHDYFHKGVNQARRVLKRNAVPSKKLPSTLAAISHQNVLPEAGPSSRTKEYPSKVEMKECENDSCCGELRSEEDFQAAVALLDLLNSRYQDISNYSEMEES